MATTVMVETVIYDFLRNAMPESGSGTHQIYAENLAQAVMAVRASTEEAPYRAFLEWRNVGGPENACAGCRGSGVKIYATTATWRGGIGGAAITPDVCDACWGSGANYRHWTNLRHRDDSAIDITPPSAETCCAACGEGTTVLRYPLCGPCFARVNAREGAGPSGGMSLHDRIAMLRASQPSAEVEALRDTLVGILRDFERATWDNAASPAVEVVTVDAILAALRTKGSDPGSDWLAYCVYEGAWVGLRTRTDGVSHHPRWESSAPMTPEEMLHFCEVADLRTHQPPSAEVEGLEDAVRWIGAVRDELVLAGFPSGDRTVALESIRKILADLRTNGGTE